MYIPGNANTCPTLNAFGLAGLGCKGLGNYMPSNWVTPQRMVNGLRSAMFQVPKGFSGLGCGCAGGCGGLGCHGLGLFDSGMDWTQWGWQEWATVAVAGYVAFSVFSSTSRGVQAVRKGRRRRAA